MPRSPRDYSNLGAPLGNWLMPLENVSFDQPPPRREIRITGWEFDDAMKMLWQHHPTMDNEGMTLPHQAHHLCAANLYAGLAGRYPAAAAG